MNRLIVALGLTLIFQTPLYAQEMPESVAEFFAGREVLGVVYFNTGASSLSPENKIAIDRIVDQFSAVLADGRTIRVEGFSSPEGGLEGNVSLAMKRAKSVLTYLSQHHRVEADLTLTGSGGPGREGLPASRQRRVELVSYARSLPFEDIPVENIAFD